MQKWSGAQAAVSLFESAEELLFNYSPGKFDVLLLDIQMNGENGISLARKIRCCNDDAAIIFITAVSDYVFEGYDVGAVQYLMKPVNESKLFDCLDKVKNTAKDSARLVFETDEGTEAISADDILYLEAISRKTKMFLMDKTVMINLNFKNAEESLPKGFFKCHRSYIVNLLRVSSIKKYESVMDNGVSVPISRRVYNEFNQAFIAFYRR